MNRTGLVTSEQRTAATKVFSTQHYTHSAHLNSPTQYLPLVGYMGRVLKCFVMDDHDSISGRLILPSQDMPHLICDSSMLPK
uniref:Uncharacterized protein n=1 Tax=Parascaris univalens TaxID=6257 RepID=A0A914ZV86_PARUN